MQITTRAVVKSQCLGSAVEHLRITGEHQYENRMLPGAATLENGRAPEEDLGKIGGNQWSTGREYSGYWWSIDKKQRKSSGKPEKHQ